MVEKNNPIVDEEMINDEKQLSAEALDELTNGKGDDEDDIHE